jgi:hypothetical protein
MDAVTRATFYLGADIQGKHTVTDTDFSLWLEDEVTPRFPGFTVRSAEGYWKGKPEPMRELVILVTDGPSATKDIEAIASSYKQRFAQEAVMVSYETVHVLWNVP